MTYKIAYQGLSLGSHRFEFEIGDALFGAIPESEVRRGSCTAVIDLQKNTAFMTLGVHIAGEVEVACDRCLEEFPLPVAFDGTLYVKFSERVEQQQMDSEGDFDTEVLWVNPAEGEIDLTQYLYESIILSLPVRRVHPVDAQGGSLCDPSMLSRFHLAAGEEEDPEEDRG